MYTADEQEFQVLVARRLWCVGEVNAMSNPPFASVMCGICRGFYTLRDFQLPPLVRRREVEDDAPKTRAAAVLEVVQTAPGLTRYRSCSTRS